MRRTLQGSDPGRGLVWVLDDSPMEAAHVGRTLAGSYDVEVFGDGNTMLERLVGRRPPDALVADWLMPDISGVDMCRHLRASPATAALPVLLLSVRRDKQDIVEGFAAGADDYLAKPYDDEELLARVSALVRTKQLRDRAEQAERNVRRLLGQLPDAVITVNHAGDLTFVNVEGERVLGARAEALVGRPLREILPDLDLARLPSTAGEDGDLPRDLRIGDRIYAPAVRLSGEEWAASTAISFRDVTEARSEEARRLDFYSIVAHDLRAPLGALILRTDLMLTGRHGPLTEALERDLQQMRKRAHEMAALINDFLDLARMEGVGLQVEAHEFDLTILVGELLEDFRMQADARGVSLHLDAGPAPGTVSGDRRRLGQVVSNLLSNAIKFSRAGGAVRVRVSLPDDQVEVAVADSGPGVAPEALPRLFQRYARALDKGHAAHGSGLGLMIVRQIVEVHRGTVGVTSQADEGSTFWFRIPRLTKSP